MNCGICRVGGLRRTEVYFGCLWDKNTDAPDFRKCISKKVFQLGYYSDWRIIICKSVLKQLIDMMMQ